MSLVGDSRESHRPFLVSWKPLFNGKDLAIMELP